MAGFLRRRRRREGENRADPRVTAIHAAMQAGTTEIRLNEEARQRGR